MMKCDPPPLCVVVNDESTLTCLQVQPPPHYATLSKDNTSHVTSEQMSYQLVDRRLVTESGEGVDEKTSHSVGEGGFPFVSQQCCRVHICFQNTERNKMIRSCTIGASTPSQINYWHEFYEAFSPHCFFLLTLDGILCSIVLVCRRGASSVLFCLAGEPQLAVPRIPPIRCNRTIILETYMRAVILDVGSHDSQIGNR